MTNTAKTIQLKSTFKTIHYVYSTLKKIFITKAEPKTLRDKVNCRNKSLNIVSPKLSVSHTLTLSRPEWLFITVGILCSVAMGALMPIFSILFGDILGVIAYPDTQKAR